MNTARAGARKMGVTRAVNVAKEPERRHGGAGMTEAIRCGSGDVRRAAGVSRYHAGHHESRRSYCDAGDSAIRYVYRLTKVIFLRACSLKVFMVVGDVRNVVVKMAGADPVRSGSVTDYHPYRFSIDDFQKGLTPCVQAVSEKLF